MPGRVAGQRRLAEVRVGRQEVGRGGAGVGEVAAATARHQDLLADLVGMVDHLHLAAALAGGDRSHQPGRAGADDHYIAADRAHALARLRQFGMMSSWIWSLRICTSPSWISTLKRIARWICWPHCSTKEIGRAHV
ncbi:hypothetical protein G6F32_016403 [Rhizopus arrhizus]|nr:hypothetical protein G6F32_016403 [Rhizopus arrhizus]